MERIMIIGSAGAGKSTLARKLGEILNLEVIHLDRLFWNPGWMKTPDEEWMKIQESLVGKDKWIIDGNYSGTMDLRIRQADTIVFIDLPRSICLWRIVKRRVQNHGSTRPDMARGCPEKLDWEFVKWVWNFPQRSRSRIIKRLEGIKEDKKIVWLHSRKEMEVFLQSIKDSMRIFERAGV